MKVLVALAKFSLWVGIPVAIVVIGLRLTYVEVAHVAHNGMAPTLFQGEKVLVWKTTDIEMGDVAICGHPDLPGQMVLGRVVAKSGMDVGATNGVLSVSGSIPTYDWGGTFSFRTPAGRPTEHRWGLEKFGNTDHQMMIISDREFRLRAREVGGGSVYLLGDNRPDTANDSRTFGDVDRTTCIGVVFMRMQPGPMETPQVTQGTPLPAHGWFDIIS